MRAIKLFEDFVKEGIVKRVMSNKQRAKSLLAESERKTFSLNKQVEKLGVGNENANDYVEYCYDMIMHIIRAKMLMEGYNASGFGAHEAEISYLRKLGFTEKDVQFADQMRYFRNGVLYYGTKLDKEYAEKTIEFTKKIYPQLKEMIQ